ncbi:MAG: hypothetical protein NC043_01495 [Muribaculaceae bacterium]|nr:hypothetical protein [Muribaculaceae bacterium]
MKRLLLSIMGLAALLTAVASTRVVEAPFIGATNALNLDFPRIELSDTSTVLHAKVTYRPKWWITISPESFIEAGGKQYYITGTSGILLGEHHTIPESGVTEFDLYFPSLPEGTQSINFKEGENSGWRTWNISLTGEPATLPSGLPAEFTAIPDYNTSVPEPRMACDSTTVRIHLLNYSPDMGDEVRAQLEMLTGYLTVDRLKAPVTDSGEATLRFLMNGPGKLLVLEAGDIRVMGEATVDPGEVLDMYIDCNYSGGVVMSNRDMNEGLQRVESWHNGRYAAFDRSNNESKYGGFELRSGKFADYHMSSDSYTDMVINSYKKLIADIAADSSLTPLARESAILTANASLIYAMDQWQAQLYYNYWDRYNAWGQAPPADSIPALKTPMDKENFIKAGRMVDLNDTRLVIANAPFGPSYFADRRWDYPGLDSRLISDINTFKKIYSKADKGEASAAEIDTLRTLAMPFYAEAVAHRDSEMKRVLASLDRSLMLSTPEVPDEEIFDAIIAPHKGKVVMVDLWNTWCGPCRNALKAHEPAKSGELSSEDIVWIYIADESSPDVNYFPMLPGIKGLHYRLTSDQMSHIRERFNVDGIPYYILVDRQGNAVGNPELRNETTYKNSILDALSRK